MTHLSLETSKKISELVGEYETEKRWREYDTANSSIRLEPTNDRLRLVTKQNYPAPCFSELIRILPRIGEKKGWDKCMGCWDLSVEDMCEMYMYATTEPEGMAAVEKYLLSIL